MIKLLRGDFARLFQSKLFLLSMAGMFLLSFCIAIVMHVDSSYQDMPTDRMMYSISAFMIAVLLAVVLGRFIGTEFRDGTIRNKLSVGHSRVSLYISELITCIFASLMLHFASLGVFIFTEAMGLTEKFELSADHAVIEMIASFLAVSAIASIFCMVCMLTASIWEGSVSVLLLSFLLTSTPGYYEGAGGTLLFDAVPTYQLRQLNDSVLSWSLGYYESLPANLNLLPMYSLLIIVLTTVIGVLIFQRKDMR